MSKQYKCPHCGFVGYPEIARKENKIKLFLVCFFGWSSEHCSSDLINFIFKRIFSSHEKWDNFSATKHLRCASCKQPLFLDQLEEQPLPPIEREEQK